MIELLLKLTLAPVLVGAASLAGRRWGQRIAGLMAALPIVGGPILVFYAVDHGAEFAARAAEQAMVGISSLAAYGVTYGRLAWYLGHRRRRWGFAVLALAWAVFMGATALHVRLPVGGWVAFLLAVAALWVGVRLLPTAAALGAGGGGEGVLHSTPSATPRAPAEAPRSRGQWRTADSLELLLRMGATAALVLGLTSAAAGVGPTLSGLLTPFPVASTVLLVATHVREGPVAAVDLLRGFLTGMWGFALFCAAVAVAATGFGLVAAFALGLIGVGLVQTVVVGRWRAAPQLGDAPRPGRTREARE